MILDFFVKFSLINLIYFTLWTYTFGIMTHLLFSFVKNPYYRLCINRGLKYYTFSSAMTLLFLTYYQIDAVSIVFSVVSLLYYYLSVFADKKMLIINYNQINQKWKDLNGSQIPYNTIKKTEVYFILFICLIPVVQVAFFFIPVTLSVMLSYNLIDWCNRLLLDIKDKLYPLYVLFALLLLFYLGVKIFVTIKMTLIKLKKT